MNYLYGASVQGIQDFIFETNRLKEMVGASELVEEICSPQGNFLKKFFKKVGLNISEEQWIRGAAGNIRLICREEEARLIVQNFPKAVQEHSPGITISQALIKFDRLNQEVFNGLEEKLRSQRNCPPRPYQVGWSAVSRSPRTGKPAYKRDQEGKLIDLATSRKREASDEEAFKSLSNKFLGDDKPYIQKGDKKIRFPLELDDMVSKNEVEWLAVIHADGNNLGGIIQKLGTSFDQDSQKIAQCQRKFSEAIRNATCKAAQDTFRTVVIMPENFVRGKFPLRPIILGGDDLTLICRADIAMDFTVTFLQNFEKETKKQLQAVAQEFSLDFPKKMTASAGIVFVKTSYPFHYAYNLAEELCTAAKKRSKEIYKRLCDLAQKQGKKDSDHLVIPSSLAFHKILSSFQESYSKIIERELTIQCNPKPIHLNFGPYSVQENIPDMPCIQHLQKCLEELKKEDAPRSGLRRWLKELYKRPQAAISLIQRVDTIASSKKEFKREQFNQEIERLQQGLSLKNPLINNTTPIFDMLTLLTVQGR